MWVSLWLVAEFGLYLMLKRFISVNQFSNTLNSVKLFGLSEIVLSKSNKDC